MGRATSREIVWIENKKKLTATRSLKRGRSNKWVAAKRSSRKCSVLGTLQQRLSALKSPSTSKTSPALVDVVNEESAVFVCCSRHDALSHARVLRSELATRLNRGCAVGGGVDTSRFIEKSDACVVLLTNGLWLDPNAIVNRMQVELVRQKMASRANQRELTF